MGCGCNEKRAGSAMTEKQKEQIDDVVEISNSEIVQDGNAPVKNSTRLSRKARGGFRDYKVLLRLEEVCLACSEFDSQRMGCGKDRECDRTELMPLRLQQGFCEKWIKSDAKKIVLRSFLSPGDILTLTAAIESLHVTYPGEYLTSVKTSCPAIWENNPHITKFEESGEAVFDVAYPAIHVSSQTSVCFLEAYLLDIGYRLRKSLRLVTNHPMLYLSDDERNWANQVSTTWEDKLKSRPLPFWLVSAGVKSDFTAKQWPVEYYQEVVSRTKGMIQWVQIGSLEHDHPQLSGVLDLRGRTDLRQLIRLAYHAQGGLGPVTLLQHLCAAFDKPYVLLLGGREPTIWTQYSLQTTLHTFGQLPCCKKAACWRSRVIPLGDDPEKDKSLCSYPVLGSARPFGKCMGLITPDRVVDILRQFPQV